MKLRLPYLAYRAMLWHGKSYITLALIVALIAAVITASLLTGFSVRKTLTANTIERLNGAGFLVSTGLRYSDRDIAGKIATGTAGAVAPLMEINGRVSGFGGDKPVNGVRVWGADSSFFSMGGGNPGDAPSRGEAVLNGRLAEALQINEGDFVIVRFATPSDLPGNTPFAPSNEEDGSLFLTVRKVAVDEPYSKFNPDISQVEPLNIFLNINEFNQFLEGREKANRFLVGYNETLSTSAIEEVLAAKAFPGGQGIRVRTVPATGQREIVSDRIFIDEVIVKELTEVIPGASPVITYLANNIAPDIDGAPDNIIPRNQGKVSDGTSLRIATPYSFVAAVSGSRADKLSGVFDIIINEWLAADIGCAVGDSLTITYYLNGEDNRLREDSSRFRVADIVPLSGMWRDSLLMPAFPGITGSRSCTEWDAGIPLDMKRIRDKDEEYWFNYAGTPKAFIRYETGAALWGNQFGPATAIRWQGDPPPAGPEASDDWLPATSLGMFGLTVTDVRNDGLRSAVSGVDFSTLFLALSFFIITSAIVLLVMLMDNHLRDREGEVSTLTALGFTARKVQILLLGEAFLPLVAGAIAGVAAGVAVNILIISALNSVWIDAVQTDTLRHFTGIVPLGVGLLATITLALGAVWLRLRSFLRKTGISVRYRSVPGGKIFAILLPFVTILTLLPFLLLLFTDMDEVMLYFAGGSMLLVLMLMLMRYLLTRRVKRTIKLVSPSFHLLSWRYFSFHPGRAVSPVLFIAAGLFIVISTGANRRDFDRDMLRRDSGTGGFTHWISTTIPFMGNLNNPVTMRESGLEIPEGEAWFMHCLKVSGDDASCLNLNHITSPHILGVDAAEMVSRGSFSFASVMKGITRGNPWEALPLKAGENAIYGFLDQTVLQWGMKLKPGDTVTVRSESGQPLHIIIAGGFRTSVFQGYLVIDRSHFTRWFPSVAGSNIILMEMNFPDAAQGTERWAKRTTAINRKMEAGTGTFPEKTTESAPPANSGITLSEPMESAPIVDPQITPEEILAAKPEEIPAVKPEEILAAKLEEILAVKPEEIPAAKPEKILAAKLEATLEPYGAIVETTPSRLESFNRVTNTYLSVFVVLGGLGMILGVTGLGLNLARNIRSRRKEYALLGATGFTTHRIRRVLLAENLLILVAGVMAGAVPAIIATLPSLATGNGLPYSILAILLLLMIAAGVVSTVVSLRGLRSVNPGRY